MGKKYSSQKKLAEGFRKFYIKLYSLRTPTNECEEVKRKDQVREYIRKAIIPILAEVINNLETLINLEEVEVPMKQSVTRGYPFW